MVGIEVSESEFVGDPATVSFTTLRAARYPAPLSPSAAVRNPAR